MITGDFSRRTQRRTSRDRRRHEELMWNWLVMLSQALDIGRYSVLHHAPGLGECASVCNTTGQSRNYSGKASFGFRAENYVEAAPFFFHRAQFILHGPRAVACRIGLYAGDRTWLLSYRTFRAPSGVSAKISTALADSRHNFFYGSKTVLLLQPVVNIMGSARNIHNILGSRIDAIGTQP